VSRFTFRVPVVLAAFVVAGCELSTVSVPPTTPSVVVHAVMNPSEGTQIVFLERTLTGAVHIPDTALFDPSDPIVSAGGIPISGALVEISDSSGLTLTGVEASTFQPNGQGRGVYGVPMGFAIRLGQRYKLHVHTQEGEDVTAFTRIPLPEVSSTGALTQTLNRDHDTLNISWDASLKARAYAMRVESPFGPFFLFTDSLHVRLTGDLRNLFAGELQHVLVPGFHQDLLVAAVDSNFFDYYRTNNDPFTGAGIISRINGGLGLFGSLVTLTNGTLTVIADQTEPIEGRFRIQAPVDSAVQVTSFNLYVESPAINSNAPAALSGRYVMTGPNPRIDGLIGKMKGNDVTLAFLANQSAGDTIAVFVGQLSNGVLKGQFAAGGVAATYAK
jgi:hypothetical protein